MLSLSRLSRIALQIKAAGGRSQKTSLSADSMICELAPMASLTLATVVSLTIIIGNNLQSKNLDAIRLRFRSSASDSTEDGFELLKLTKSAQLR
jgi:hypothetical protein